MSNIYHDYKTYRYSRTKAEIFNHYFSAVVNDLISNKNFDSEHATVLFLHQTVLHFISIQSPFLKFKKILHQLK